jgi:hypothetical protein
LAASFLPEPGGSDSASYTEQLSALLLEVFVRTKGRAMGLFTSYEMMHQIARVLEEPLRQEGIRLLVHGTHGTRDQITRLFRSGKASVLFGTHSFWEGVDVAGDALSCVVMARLPFAVVGDPIVEARCEQIEQRGGSAFREFSLPQLIEKMTCAPARILNLNRGTLRVGAIADVTVIDLDKTWVVDADSLASKSKNSPWLGETMTGAAALTVRAGTVVYEGR